MKTVKKVNWLKLSLILAVVLSMSSCATSMSPSEVNSTLPTFTTSKFMSQAQAEEAVKTGKCKYLYKGRQYTAPISSTTKSDLRYGAKGIDEWVTVDGGNAYVLTNYKWVTVGNQGATQLYLEFDTMKCE